MRERERERLTVPLAAAVTPALSFLNPCRFAYDENSSTGTNAIGRTWSGRKCSAVISVARPVGAKEESVCFREVRSDN